MMHQGSVFAAPAAPPPPEWEFARGIGAAEDPTYFTPSVQIAALHPAAKAYGLSRQGLCK
jgi:hypothetical protein